jgi:hypothetical protein
MASKATPDLSEFEALSKPRKPPCQVGAALAALEAKQAAQLRAACEAPAITVAGIRTWLEQRGHAASVSGITSHRRRTCTCHG